MVTGRFVQFNIKPSHFISINEIQVPSSHSPGYLMSAPYKDRSSTGSTHYAYPALFVWKHNLSYGQHAIQTQPHGPRKHLSSFCYV